ncbi:MAG: AmmeMemoRadiSam system radical SAM enzyme [Dermatophilus congolensis]|nr:AmmeMemoRadiSam system radical SAM enzyme [Dermatophilus congolensis]
MAAIQGEPARFWHRLDDGRVQCDVCPRECRLREGQRGFCFVRGRPEASESSESEGLVLTAYGRSTGFCIDPIEKKPLSHFFPGTPVLSFGTAGCNLGCRFCQNWEISTSSRVEALSDAASPADIARTASEWQCTSVAFTYNDPVIFAEYAIDTAVACRERGIRTVAVTAGYVLPGARAELFDVVDAANVDLKGFSETFYRKVTGSRLSTVLDTLVYLVHSTSVWVEITTLLIPGFNDSDADIRRLCEWVYTELGPDVPLHFTAFHPDHKLRDVAATPKATVGRARRIGLDSGLHFVYTGNVSDVEGATTSCASCKRKIIVREGYTVTDYRIDTLGRCAACGAPVPGRFGNECGDFGTRRIPVRISIR